MPCYAIADCKTMCAFRKEKKINAHYIASRDYIPFILIEHWPGLAYVGMNRAVYLYTALGTTYVEGVNFDTVRIVNMESSYSEDSDVECGAPFGVILPYQLEPYAARRPERVEGE